MKLSSEAKSLLIEAAKDPSGSVRFAQYLDELSISVGNKNFVERNPRSEAKWKKALNDLIKLELVEQDKKGYFYPLTEKGFDLAEKLISNPNTKINIDFESDVINSKTFFDYICGWSGILGTVGTFAFGLLGWYISHILAPNVVWFFGL